MTTSTDRDAAGKVRLTIVVAAVVSLTALALLFAGEVESVPGLLRFVGRLHPLVVHAPIGFVMALVVGEVVSFRAARSGDAPLGRATSAIAWLLLLSAGFAYVAGFLLSTEGDYAPALVASHQRLAAGVVVGAASVLVLRATRRQTMARTALAVTCVLVILAGDVGGRLSHGPTWLTKFAPWPSAADTQAAQANQAPSDTGVVDARPVAVIASERLDAGADPASLTVDAGVDAAPSEARASANASIPSVTPRRASASLSSPDSRALSPPRDVDAGVVSSNAAITRAATRPTATTTTTTAPTATTTPATDAGTLSVDASAPAPLAWDAVVAPIFSVRCSACHGPEKKKAKMRLDTYDGVMRGGEDGKVVVAGDPSASMMMKRLLLPLDHDDHMPPKKKPQPSAAELEVLRWWIAHGAAKDTALDAGGLTPETVKAAQAAIRAARDAQAAASETGDAGMPASRLR